MSTRIVSHESSCPLYLVGLETHGGGNHNYKHVRNKISLFGLFILGNMDKLNVACGYPGISFPNISGRSMYFMNIDLSGIALKSNVKDRVQPKIPSSILFSRT